LSESQAARLSILDGTVETVGMQRNITIDFIQAVGAKVLARVSRQFEFEFPSHPMALS